MSAATTFTTADGKRQAELISLTGKVTFKVTDPRHTTQGGDVLKFIPATTIRQCRTIGGKQTEITLLAPITLARLHAAGISQRDLEAWGLVPPPIKSEAA